MQLLSAAEQPAGESNPLTHVICAKASTDPINAT